MVLFEIDNSVEGKAEEHFGSRQKDITFYLTLVKKFIISTCVFSAEKLK